MTSWAWTKPTCGSSTSSCRSTSFCGGDAFHGEPPPGGPPADRSPGSAPVGWWSRWPPLLCWVTAPVGSWKRFRPTSRKGSCSTTRKIPTAVRVSPAYLDFAARASRNLVTAPWGETHEVMTRAGVQGAARLAVETLRHSRGGQPGIRGLADQPGRRRDLRSGNRARGNRRLVTWNPTRTDWVTVRPEGLTLAADFPAARAASQGPVFPSAGGGGDHCPAAGRAGALFPGVQTGGDHPEIPGRLLAADGWAHGPAYRRRSLFS